MSLKNYGQKGKGLAAYGRGSYIQQYPDLKTAKQSDFSGGYNVGAASQAIPRNSSPFALDTEVSVKGEIVRAPGIDPIETFITNTPTQLVPHASLDLAAELLLFDAPFLGVYSGGVVAWTNYALPTGVYAWTNFGGTLIFSTGELEMYARQPGGAPAVVADGPPAKAYANFAGRIFAGHVEDASVVLPLGIMWSGSSSLHDDWTGPGAGAEELISNRLEVDYIQALIPLGFDHMAVVMRRSIWVATRTGLDTRPADFESRIEGDGAVSPRCCVATPYGVAYLSDDGVKVFDGNSFVHISAQVDADMLPSNFSSVDGYETYYHEEKDRLYLVTPTDLWVYDFKPKRWYRRSLVVRAAASFGLGAPGGYDMYFLGVDSLGRVTLGCEDENSVRYFDALTTPLWEFPLEEGDYVNQVISTQRVHIDYLGEGTVDLWMRNTEGEFDYVETLVLPVAGGRYPRPLNSSFLHSGRGVNLQLQIAAGNPRISSVALEYVPAGPVLPAVSVRERTLFAVRFDEYDPPIWGFLPYDEVGEHVVGGLVLANDGIHLVPVVGAEYTGKIITRTVDGHLTLTDP